MKFFKIFKKKEKKEKIIEEVKEEETNLDLLPSGTKLCGYCEKAILPHDPRKSFHGKKFHIKCWRNQIKDAKKTAFN